MENTAQLKALRVALVLVGLTFVFGIYLLGRIWPSGWVWNPAGHQYLEMIMGIYATLGVFLILAAKNPLAHRSLIWFTVWSSVVHGIIMAVQAVRSPADHGHLYGDVPALLLVALVFALLMPRKTAVAS